MADKRYEVEARFRVDDRLLKSGLTQAEAAAKRLDERIDAVRLSFARIGSLAVGAAGLGAATYAMQRMAGSAIEMLSNLEDTRLGMASILESTSKGTVGFTGALEQADGIMRRLRANATALPGTFAELRQAFSTMLPSLRPLGASIEDIEKLATMSVVAAKTQSVMGGADVVARDIRQILSGSASAAEISTPTLQANAGGLAELAKSDKARALKEIMRLLQTSPEALAAVSQTLNAQWSTLVDRGQQFVEAAGSPVFEAVVMRLAEWNAWLAKNEEKVQQIAKEIGDRLVSGLRAAERIVLGIADSWDTITTTVKFLAEVWIGSKLVGAIRAAKLEALALSGSLGAGGRGGAMMGALRGLGPVGLGVIGYEAISSLYNSDFVQGPQYIREQKELAEKTRERLHEDLMFGRVAPELVSELEKRRHAGQVRLANTNPLDAIRNSEKARSKNPAERADALLEFVTESQLVDIALGQQRAAHEKANQDRKWALDRLLYVNTKEDLKLRTASLGDTAGGVFSAIGSGIAGSLTTAVKKLAEGIKVDARGSSFHFNQNFDTGDPDRIYFELRRDIITPFVPALGSTLAPT